MIDGTLSFDLTQEYGMLAAMVGVALLAGLVAGSYPAFYLSAFQPGAALKATLEGARPALVARALPARGGHSLFREALEVARGMADVLKR